MIDLAKYKNVGSSDKQKGRMPKHGSSLTCLRNDTLMMNCLPCEPTGRQTSFVQAGGHLTEYFRLSVGGGDDD
jgi:hypothetical protein